MNYKKIFNPKTTEVFQEIQTTTTGLGDRCHKSAYVYNEDIILAVNVAIVTGRPILVRGPSGCGKSSLARNVVKVLGWRYFEKVISSRTQARDLLYEVDMLRRLQDAQTRELKKDFASYINPGVLWWAFDPENARKYGSSPPTDTKDTHLKKLECDNNQKRAVVLLDEMDKADPDVPNNLLVPLGSLQFQVDEMNTEIRCKEPPLVIITTNDERELPPAFLRRCVELNLSKPDMLDVGIAHFGIERLDILKKVVDLLNDPADGKDIKASSASPAEFKDTVQACIDLGINPESDEWDLLTKVTVWKHGRISGNRK